MDYDRIADLQLTIESVDLERRERDTSSDFTRVTTVVTLAGAGPDGERVQGRGEDVTYAAAEHDALARTGLPDLTGEYTVDSFSARVGDLDCFPAGEPEREDFRHYRRWALESAALDLALRRADSDVASALGLTPEPVRFVASTRLGDPPSIDRVERLRERVPGLEFKLDPTPEWDDDLIDALAALDAVRVLDLKGHYEGTEVDAPPDPDRYERAIERFPEAVIEDPALTPDTEPLFEDPDVRERVAWDAPIHGVEDVRDLPWEPGWLNVKPSRFGSLASLFETVAHCRTRGIELYGGGQFELGVGRGQLQLLASLWYPDGPNDVAPRAFNLATPSEELPASPLAPPRKVTGFRWE